MMELYQELQQKTQQLDVSIKALRKTGTEYAQAERAYKVKLREECLKLRDQGRMSDRVGGRVRYAAGFHKEIREKLLR